MRSRRGRDRKRTFALIGAEASTGFVGAFANTREITRLIAGVTLAAQVGAGFTAELGAMRVNEEMWGVGDTVRFAG
jgi:ABC-type transporter Mla maintaining outer membrane lipid asymmetry permease subunit MlaE